MEQGQWSLCCSPFRFFHFIHAHLYHFFMTLILELNFSDSSIGKVVKLSHVLVVSAGLIAAVTAAAFSHRSTVIGERKNKKNKKVIPLLRRTESGRLGEIEKFSHYFGKMFALGVSIPLYSLYHSYAVSSNPHFFPS